jgi:hypothetical protein
LPSATPETVSSLSAQLADRLSTPTPVISGQLGSEINQYISELPAV